MRSVETLLVLMDARGADEVTLWRLRGMPSADKKVAWESSNAAAAEPHAARSASSEILLSRDEYLSLKNAGAIVEDPTLG